MRDNFTKALVASQGVGKRKYHFAESAPTLWEQGVNVLPIVPRQKFPPNGLKWERWKTERQTPSEIRLLVERYAKFDIAVILGEVSGGLLDLETDGSEGKAKLRELIQQYGALPLTAAFRSERGIHILVRTSIKGEIVKPKELGLKDLEFRWNEHYSIVPPSGGRRWRIQDWKIESLSPRWEEFLRIIKGANVSLLSAPLAPFTTVSNIWHRDTFTTVSTIVPDQTAKKPFVDIGSHLTTDNLQVLARPFGYDPAPKLNQYVKCAFHKERRPSAQFILDNKDRLVYRCWHAEKGSKLFTMTLGEAYHAYKSKLVLDDTDVRRLNAPELSVWALRLLVEAKIFSPAEVIMRELPFQKISNSLRKVYEGAKLLYQCKWTYDYGVPSPLANSFMPHWCGVSLEMYSRAKKILLDEGIIWEWDCYRRTPLYIPDPLYILKTNRFLYERLRIA